MSSTLYKNSGLVLKKGIIQEWVPDPPSPYNPPSSGYKPSQTEKITRSAAGYIYKGKTFSTYSAAVKYRDSGAGEGGFIAAGPGMYTPHLGYYYKNGKVVTSVFYVRDPITGVPIAIRKPKRF